MDKQDWRGVVEKLVGSYPLNLADGMHNHDGHLLRLPRNDGTGEEALVGDLGAVMASQGIEYACEDDTNAHFDVQLVREAPELGMK